MRTDAVSPDCDLAAGVTADGHLHGQHDRNFHLACGPTGRNQAGSARLARQERQERLARLDLTPQ